MLVAKCPGPLLPITGRSIGGLSTWENGWPFGNFVDGSAVIGERVCHSQLCSIENRDIYGCVSMSL